MDIRNFFNKIGQTTSKPGTINAVTASNSPTGKTRPLKRAGDNGQQDTKKKFLPVVSNRSPDNDVEDFQINTSKTKKHQISPTKLPSRVNKSRKVLEYDDDEDIKVSTIAFEIKKDLTDENTPKSPSDNDVVTPKRTSSSVSKQPTTPLSAKRRKSTPPSTTKAKRPSPPPEEKKRRADQYKAYLNRSGPKHYGEKDIPEGSEGCLEGLIFVISGVLDSLERDECKDLIKKYGGDVKETITKTKTNYLILGDQGGESKKKKAEDYKIKIINEDGLLEMIRTRPGKRLKPTQLASTASTTQSASSQPISPPAATKSSSFYSNKISPKTTNRNNKGFTETFSDIQSSTPEVVNNSTTQKPSTSSENNDLLWADKYRPTQLKQIIGQQGEKSCVEKLMSWLKNWHKYHGKNAVKQDKKKTSTWNKNDDPALFKAALLSGPPGIGKTTTAQLVCKELNLPYIERNASDQRSKKTIQQYVADSISNTHLSATALVAEKHVLIMDEVDGSSGNEDRGGIQELIQLIKRSQIPIICICNDRQSQKIRSLANYCYDLRFHKPKSEQIKGCIKSILFKEHVEIKSEILDQIILSCNQDIRQVIHSCNLWYTSQTPLKYQSSSYEHIDKGVNTNIFELCRKSLSNESRNLSIFEKSDLFFDDYRLVPLFIQENYLRVTPTTTSKDLKMTTNHRLNLISKAADSICLGDLTSKIVYSSNDWSLLPYMGIFSTVAPSSLVRGTTSRIEFPKWLGQCSKTNKCVRLLTELEKHTSLQISTGNKTEFNLDYMHYLSSALITPLQQEGSDGIAKCIEFMNDYYLTREDLQTIVELTSWNDGKKSGDKNSYEQIDSKIKAQLTRTFNKQTHKTPYQIIDLNKLKKTRQLENEDEIDVEKLENGEIEEDSSDDAEQNTVEADVMIKKSTKKAVASEPSSTKAPAKRGRKK
ncbi:unnamed protein product [Didymodactylos carnosus]|uniref:Replication factor C subunit 1 n=1 Tax=Didymodactylos carnosus TaxID=1234261 RepID=A0A813RQB8_9BILA|nr:unnamed protein product [Didymodactylos carnosus]CAF0784504.1 unnamed protein product [Didymodactylos carnosus]CAF3545503.1 unnamed protein product [Didymodactylos carnosus]CAF3568106.1 unnamed protein product [Didymodactylos carnosus]